MALGDGSPPPAPGECGFSSSYVCPLPSGWGERGPRRPRRGLASSAPAEPGGVSGVPTGLRRLSLGSRRAALSVAALSKAALGRWPWTGSVRNVALKIIIFFHLTLSFEKKLRAFLSFPAVCK